MPSFKQLDRVLRSVAGFFAAVTLTVNAAQTDIAGPAGSGQFGSIVAVLPNGNFVVTDPGRDTTVTDAGAVYLYSPAGVLISTLTGSTANDRVGIGGIRVLANGNYVVMSPFWINGTAANAGAVTWASASTGRAGAVSSTNSLVGTATDDFVGSGRVTALANGHYVVGSPDWHNGASADAGAATWGNGTTGRTGVVSPANSLVGSTAGDRVGADFTVVALSNGHYVVQSGSWDNGAIANVGAVTWGNGTTGRAGAVSPSNSLVGTTSNDAIGNPGVVEVGGGNYVVPSPMWDNGALANVGAVTWANGSTGLIGTVSATNSLVGTTLNDRVGNQGAVPLANGNYVVTSESWNNGAVVDAGAVTWANGNTGRTGPVSASNSLIGTTSGDGVGSGSATALTNGHYVVASYFWNNGVTLDVGAVTWCDGTTGRTGTVSTANSLIGTRTDDIVGGGGVVALTNGHYVVSSNEWDNGTVVDAGAVTWGNGSTGRTGAVSAANSLVGTTAADGVGSSIVVALANGNYVVPTPYWDNGAVVDAGAVTWANGSNGRVGAVTPANSLVGTSAGDEVGANDIAALVNGNYVVFSPSWSNGPTADVGAVTWADGSTGRTGAVSPANSLIGTTMGDSVGSIGGLALSDGKYAIHSHVWDNGPIVDAGAVTLSRGGAGVIGTIVAANSVRGTVANAGTVLPIAYDATRERLIVGRRASNLVSLFTLPPDNLFANGFD